ncbi:MAG: response regulator [Deltaproteobacteria bacterium]|nr:response regulator [Deltaproteobacteria bacterium]
MNLLIVEDDVETAGGIVEMVTLWGHWAEPSFTGRDALRKAEERPFDLALLDIFLPDIRGYDLIPRLRDVCPDMKIVAMTGYNTRELELRVRREGVLYYMIKPFEGETLKTLLDYITQRRHNGPGDNGH